MKLSDLERLEGKVVRTTFVVTAAGKDGDSQLRVPHFGIVFTDGTYLKVSAGMVADADRRNNSQVLYPTLAFSDESKKG